MVHARGDAAPERTGNRHGGLGISPYNVYPTNDGYVVLNSPGDHHFRAILDVMGRPDLKEDPRFITRCARVENFELVDELIETLDADASRQGRRGRQRMLAAAVPCAPVRNLREVMHDQNMHARGSLQWIDHPELGPRRPAAYAARTSRATPRRPIEPSLPLGREQRGNRDRLARPLAGGVRGPAGGGRGLSALAKTAPIDIYHISLIAAEFRGPGCPTCRRAPISTSPACCGTATMSPGPRGPASRRACPARLVRQLPGLPDVTLVLGMVTTRHLDELQGQPPRFLCLNGAANTRKAAALSGGRIVPAHVSAIPELILSRPHTGRRRADPGPADRRTRTCCRSGSMVDFVHEMIDAARVVVAEVDERMPLTADDALIARDTDHPPHRSRTASSRRSSIRSRPRATSTSPGGSPS